MAKARRPTTARTRATTGARPRTRKAAVVESPPGVPLSPDAVARRAYEIFCRRGSTHGEDWADWLAAEQELAAEVSGQPPGSSGAS